MDCILTTGFLGPKSSRDFRETGPWSDSRRWQLLKRRGMTSKWQRFSDFYFVFVRTLRDVLCLLLLLFVLFCFYFVSLKFNKHLNPVAATSFRNHFNVNDVRSFATLLKQLRKIGLNGTRTLTLRCRCSALQVELSGQLIEYCLSGAAKLRTSLTLIWFQSAVQMKFH